MVFRFGLFKAIVIQHKVCGSKHQRYQYQYQETIIKTFCVCFFFVLTHSMFRLLSVMIFPHYFVKSSYKLIYQNIERDLNARA